MAQREGNLGIPGTAPWPHRGRPCRVGDLLPGKAVQILGEHSHANAWLGRVGPARVMEAQVPPVRIGRERLALDTPAPGFQLVVHLEGSGRYSGDCGSVDVGEGSVILMDTSEACEVVHPAGAHVVVWDLPWPEMAALLPRTRRSPFRLARGVAKVVSAHAVALARAAADVPEPQGDGLVDNLVNLIGFALADDSCNAQRANGSHRALMRQRIVALIQARFAEPGLSSRSAARELGFSRRWLSALLKGGPGFSEQVAARRVEESIRLLRDPAARDVSVAQIAFAAGFRDLSTFHRQFRRRVGMSPNAVR